MKLHVWFFFQLPPHFYSIFRHSQPSTQSQNQPRFPQPIPSNTGSGSSRDWDQRQERSNPDNRGQSYQQSNYNEPSRGFNNQPKGNGYYFFSLLISLPKDLV